jgi:hypothetical protein
MNRASCGVWGSDLGDDDFAIWSCARGQHRLWNKRENAISDD